MLPEKIPILDTPMSSWLILGAGLAYIDIILYNSSDSSCYFMLWQEMIWCSVLPFVWIWCKDAGVKHLKEPFWVGVREKCWKPSFSQRGYNMMQFNLFIEILESQRPTRYNPYIYIYPYAMQSYPGDQKRWDKTLHRDHGNRFHPAMVFRCVSCMIPAWSSKDWSCQLR